MYATMNSAIKNLVDSTDLARKKARQAEDAGLLESADQLNLVINNLLDATEAAQRAWNCVPEELRKF